MEIADNQNIDWQDACTSIASRSRHLLNEKKHTDCLFLVGSDEPNRELIVAHKIILAGASPVFEAQFYGGIPLEDKPIEIPDIEPPAFHDLLGYIYIDELPIAISFDDACHLYSAAKKYLIADLVSKCTEILSNVKPEVACRTLEFANFHQLPKIEAKCKTMIIERTNEVLLAPDFVNIRAETVLAIFEIVSANCTELDFITAFKKYIIKHQFDMPKLMEQYKEHKEDLTQEETYVIEALSKIRFLTLTTREFADHVANSKMFSAKDELAIVMNIICSDKTEKSPYSMPLGYSTHIIKRLKPSTLLGFQNSSWPNFDFQTSQQNRAFAQPGFSFNRS